MRPVDERVVRLLQLLFEAPTDRQAWTPFFEALGAAISPDVRVAILVERRQPSPTVALFGAGFESVVEGTLPRRTDGGPRIDRLPVGAVFELPRLPPALRRDPLIERLLAPTGLLPGPGLGIVVDRSGDRASGALLVLPRREGWKPTPTDRQLLETLAPFLAQATRHQARFFDAGAVTSILDRLALGVALIDERGRVSYLNRSAAEMLSVEPGLSDPGESAEPDARTGALYRTVRPADDAGGSQYRHPIDGRPLHVLSTRLEWPAWQGHPARRFARALFIGDLKQGSGDPFGNLGRLYGLTESEAQLAALLVGDFTVMQAAEHLGITESTARTVLKRILAKTGTRRQASLVRLLLSGPGQIRDDHSPRADQKRPARSLRKRRR
jgi:DNA-binding CsgD family transcriptional regulator